MSSNDHLAPDPLLHASALEQAHAIRTGRITARGLVELTIERMQAVEPYLNAVVTSAWERAIDAAIACDREQARGRRRGILHGVPMSVKDSHDTAGLRTTWGTSGRSGTIPSDDSTAVARLRRAGAIIVAKSNTPELTLAFSTENLIVGRTENPWRPGHSPGGSSGGAAALLAAGATALELGSDLGGSIRVPAAWCGVAGLKPTAGRVPRTGHAIGYGGLLDHFGTIGPMARTCKDLLPLLKLIAGPDGRDPAIAPADFPAPANPPARVGVLRTPVIGPLSAPVEQALERARRTLRERHVTVVPVDAALWTEAWCLATLSQFAHLRPLVARILEACGTVSPHRFLAHDEDDHDAIDGMRHYFESLGEVVPLSRALRQLADGRGALSGDEVELLAARRDAVAAEFLASLSGLDAVIAPAVGAVAPPHRTVDGLGFPYANPVNLFGVPSVAVPVGQTPDGLPLGLQVIARHWHEARAIAVAELLEVRGPLALRTPKTGLLVAELAEPAEGPERADRLARLAGDCGATLITRPAGVAAHGLLARALQSSQAVLLDAPVPVVRDLAGALDVDYSVVTVNE